MGQRTAIILKKNYGNNRSTITVIHHQWGIGKVMPSLLLQEVLRSMYPLNREHEYIDKSQGLPLNIFYTFEPLNNPRNNYVTNKEVKTDDSNEDIWNANVRVKYGNMTDNNNGLMLVEVTQKYDNQGKPKNYGDMFDVKVGFALGSEEISFYHKKLDGWIDIEPKFVRLVSMEEYALRTFRHSDPNVNKETKAYIKNVLGILKYAEVKEVYDRKDKKLREEREAHIKNVIESLTQGLPENQRIPVPEELKQLTPIYK